MLKSAAIEKEPSARNANSVPQQRGMLKIEKILKQAERFGGDKLAAHFVAREASALQQQIRWRPWRAAEIAAEVPAGPPPMMIRS